MYFKYLLILSLFFPALAIGQDLNNLKTEVEKLIEYEYNLNFEEEEGIWIGVIDRDSTFFFSVGNIQSDSLAPYQVGSISKIFTAALAEASLETKGISTSEKITAYLPLDLIYDQITIDQLFTHRSSFSKLPAFFGKFNTNPENPFENYNNEIIIPQLNRYASMYRYQQEDGFRYAHTNYALLGLMLESIEEQDYCTLVESSFGDKYPSLQCSDLDTSLSTGYNKAGIPSKPWSFPGFASSEGLSMNLIDLTHYIHTVFDRENNFDRFMVSKNLYFEAPWYVIKEKRNKRIYSFSGTTSIHSTFVCLNKENKTAVVMIRNSAKGIVNLPLAILSMVDDSNKKNK